MAGLMRGWLSGFRSLTSPPDTEKFPRLAETVLRLGFLRLRLKENFDRFNLNFTRRSRMVDFRRWILALAVLALFAGLAGAQTAGTSQLICGSNVSVTPTLRAEGFTEETGDITLSCTGGTALPAGTVIPTVNITVFLNTAVTSRLFSTGPNISEALLLIDEPGSSVPPIVANFGPQAPQSV